MANLTNSPFNEIFSSKLQDRMDETMAFTRLWDNVSSWVSGSGAARTVNIPQYTASADIMQDYVEVGGANYGFSSTGDNRAAEGNLQFDLISHQTKPISVVSLEDVITQYDKFGGTVRNTISRLVEFKGKSLLFQAGKDVAAGKLLETTGAATSKGPDGVAGRSATTYYDITQIALAMDEDNVSEEGRFMIIPARMYSDLLNSGDIEKANELGTGEAPIATGVVAKIAGINLIKKNTVLNMSGNTSGANAMDPFISEAAQTYHGAIAFVQEGIAFASTSVETFTNERDPQKFGDEFSAQIFGSANAARSDGKGIYILAQG